MFVRVLFGEFRGFLEHFWWKTRVGVDDLGGEKCEKNPKFLQILKSCEMMGNDVKR